MNSEAVSLRGAHPVALTAQASAAFRDVQRRYERVIARMATRLARGDEMLRDELEQAGLEALWHTDASRVAPSDEKLLLIRIRDRMKDLRRVLFRAERRAPERAVPDRTLARLEAEAVEPACMRRARRAAWDPQDPCTEHL